jgi:hypothetical protein
MEPGMSSTFLLGHSFWYWATLVVYRMYNLDKLSILTNIRELLTR